MKFWLVCVVLLFLGSEATQWLGQIPWLNSVELSLPMAIVGGIGLAIASNYALLSGRHRPGLGTAVGREATAAIAPQSVPVGRSSNALPTAQLSNPAAKPAAIANKAESISFEIKKQT